MLDTTEFHFRALITEVDLKSKFTGWMWRGTPGKSLRTFGDDRAVENATDWFLSNANLERDEQETSLTLELEQADSPRDAAQIMVETAYDRMVAASATFEE
jgi:hypothetical protein